MADKKKKKAKTLTRGNRDAVEARLAEIMASMPTRDRRK
jgi:hypothetical protein